MQPICNLERTMGFPTGVLLLVGLFGYATSNCADGWLRHGNTCYHFSHDVEPWSNAFQICQILGGNLLQIEDASESSYITGQLSSRSNYQPYIALADLAEENMYVWMVSNTHLDSSSFTNWAPGQPGNGGGQENCVHLTPDGHWNDYPCSHSRPYICEKLDEGSTEIIG